MSAPVERRCRRIARFGPFELDLDSRDLRRGSRRIRLAAQPSQVLSLLVERSDELIGRDEIQALLWDDKAIEVDAGINACIRQIRRALGESHREPVYVETKPRQGYRFIAPVEWSSAPVDGGRIAAEPHPPRSLDPRADHRRVYSHVGLGIAFLLLAVVIVWMARPTWEASEAKAPAKATAESRDADIVRIAVLPFDNLSAAGEREPIDHLGDGIMEDLITEISRLMPTRLRVIARSSASRFRGSEKSITEIGRELDVDYVVEGSYRGEAERLRIVAQLIRVGDRSALWSRRLETTEDRLLDIQLEVAGSVARAILPNLDPPLEARPLDQTVDPRAREAYLLGRHLVHRRERDADRRAVPLLEEAIRLAPDLAPAYVELSRALRSSDRADALESRRDLIGRALHIEPDLPEALLEQSRFALYADWDYVQAEGLLRRALHLQPGFAEANQALSMLLAILGRYSEAVQALEEARGLDPVSAALHADGGLIYYMSRHYDRVDEACHKAMELDPRQVGCLDILYQSRLQQRRPEEALVFARRLMKRRGALDEEIAKLEESTIEDRIRAYDRWNLASLKKQGAPGILMAAAHLAVGEVDQAFEHLHIALSQRSSQILLVPSDPRADALREDPRLARITRQLGLPHADQSYPG